MNSFGIKASQGLSCLVLGILLVAGCTVRPVAVRSSQASFDGNQQNSGLIGYDAAGNRIVTPHLRERFNGLVATYGNRFSPPVTADAGVTATATNTFLIDQQHWSYFLTMNRWRKEAGK
jgi:hypothetical protein